MKGRTKAKDYLVPADYVFTRLIDDLRLAKDVRTHVPENADLANSFERKAWSYLIEYLITKKRPPIRI
jgi:hypothetical protein